MNIPSPMEWVDLPMDRLLTLEDIGGGGFRNLPNDTNRNGRSYGGHSIAMALLAASQTVPEDHPAASLQFLFLSGALSGVQTDYQVTALQDGKRFSSRHIRAQQHSQIMLDAHATFARQEPSDVPRSIDKAQRPPYRQR